MHANVGERSDQPHLIQSACIRVIRYIGVQKSRGTSGLQAAFVLTEPVRQALAVSPRRYSQGLAASSLSN